MAGGGPWGDPRLRGGAWGGSPVRHATWGPREGVGQSTGDPWPRGWRTGRRGGAMSPSVAAARGRGGRPCPAPPTPPARRRREGLGEAAAGDPRGGTAGARGGPRQPPPGGGGAGGRRLPRPEARPGRRVPPGDSPRRPVTRSGTGGAGSGPAAPEASACGIPPAPGAAPTRRGTGDNVRTGTGVGGVVGVWGQGPPPPHRGGGGGQGRAAATSARCGDSGMARPERGDPGDGCPIPSPRQGGRQPGLD